VLDCGLVVLVTSWSPSHSAGIGESIAAGARVLSMPGLTRELIETGAATADYGRVQALTEVLGERLAAGRRITLSTAAGTRLEAELGGWARLPLLDGGPLPRSSGGLGNFPAGEAAIAPIEGTASGRIVADLTVSTTKAPLTTPIELTVRDGSVVDIAGGPEAERLSRVLAEVGPSAHVVAEIALGTNERALHVGVVLEDEKALGTAHVGLGNALAFGGLNESAVHVDAIFADVTASVDGVPLLVDGAVTDAATRRESLADLEGAGGRFVASGAPTEARDGRLFVRWHDVRGVAVWSQVGDADAARAARGLLERGALDAVAGTEAARVLEVLERYRVVTRAA
jgi:leucyl aminopeptidase (aminopeptidase T)